MFRTFFACRTLCCAAILSLSLAALSPRVAFAADRVALQPGDHVCLIGNAFAERLQYFGYFETLLHQQFPQLKLVVRNLGYAGDEVAFRPRSLDFGSPDEHLALREADVVLAFFGFNESFQGPAGLDRFRADLHEFVTHTLQQQYNGRSPARLVLVSPIAHEDLRSRNLPDGKATNANLTLYTQALAEVAAAHDVPFVDLFTVSQTLYAEAETPYTFNGIHLSESGMRRMAPVLLKALTGAERGWSDSLEPLRAEVLEKNFNHFHDYRAVNGYYIYGDRSRRDHSNPPYTDAYVLENERAKLRDMAAVVDERIWTVAAGGEVPATVDYSQTRPLYDVPTNFKQPIEIKPPEEVLETFTVAEGYAVNLFASEREFPELKNPVNFTFDAKGRLWVATMPTYPQYQPPEKPNDKLLILEDTDGDGVADQQTVFADGLHLPTGFELGDGGVYVAQEPNLMFLKDTDGDGRADERRLLLHGFDSADSHHAIGAFTWGPGGGLYMHEGTFHHTQVETPYGPVRNAHGAVYRYDPTIERFETFVSYNFANPWGHCFDRWGQNFVADASGGANYFGTAFSTRPIPFTGQPDFGPFKFTYQESMEQFFPKRVRPTAGCELVSSRHFPPEAQGNYLLNNVIGFQGVLQHVVTEQGSGFGGKEIEPILFSSDPNFRPTDLQFGPDGALYVVDWFNPLIGHMQHSLRDPNRDHMHGRIWRITYPSRPLVEPAKIEGASLKELVELLAAYEDRTRYRVRLKLREFPTEDVMRELRAWLDRVDASKTGEAGYGNGGIDHHRLEALWVCQHHNAFDRLGRELLEALLASDTYQARAATTRVIGYWRDHLTQDEAIELLRRMANDAHPRVRLEAVRAASYFDLAAAAEAALEVLKHPTDYYIDYALRHTIRRLEEFWKPTVGAGEPFARGNPDGIRYIVSRVSTPDLVNMVRNETVYRELLTRHGVVPQYRHEALEGLARLHGTDVLTELLQTVQGLDQMAGEHSEHVLADMTHLFSMQEPADLQESRSRLEKLARQGQKPITRRIATVALVTADGTADQVWKAALDSPAALQDFTDSVPLIPDPDTRSAQYERLAELVTRLPDALPTAAREAALGIRRSAIAALSYIPGQDARTFRRLAPLVANADLRNAAIQSLGRLQRSELPKQEVPGTVRVLLEFIESIPAADRTQTEVMDAIQLCKDLSALLPKEDAVAVRRQLSELAVDVIVVRPIPHRMQYDRPHMYVQAGKPVEIVFENIDIMPHNLVVTVPGAREEVGIMAERLGASPEAFAKQFVPETPKVLHATAMLQPGQQQRLQIVAPQNVGDYPYVCTFPGHWRTMYGTMHVVADVSDIPLEPIAPTPLEDVPQRQFVRKWSVSDLLSSVSELESGRDFERGRRLFQEISCLTCHAMKGEGGKVGPDLADVSKKLADRKMTLPEVVESLVVPSKVIDPRYRTQIIIDERGKAYSGVVLSEDEDVLRLIANPLDKNAEVQEIAKAAIEDRAESLVSVMPEGLLNTMTKREILDLLAYVLSAADPDHPAFR